MAVNVLNSKRAIHMSVYVVCAFVRMRQALITHTDMETRLAEVEKTLIGHDTVLHDRYKKIRPLWLSSSVAPRSRIGFCGGEA